MGSHSADFRSAEREGSRMTLQPLGWVVIRTPLLPFERWLLWTDLPTSSACDYTQENLKKREDSIRLRLLSELTPSVLQALFFASPSLYSSIGAWMKDPKSRRGAATERTLVAFLSRMSTRSTPFGLCAG
jgi:hypothetical protein